MISMERTLRELAYNPAFPRNVVKIAFLETAI